MNTGTGSASSDVCTSEHLRGMLESAMSATSGGPFCRVGRCGHPLTLQNRLAESPMPTVRRGRIISRRASASRSVSEPDGSVIVDSMAFVSGMKEADTSLVPRSSGTPGWGERSAKYGATIRNRG